MTSPLRDGSSRYVIIPVRHVATASLLEPCYASLTVFEVLPARYVDASVPLWAWKDAEQQLNALRLQMWCRWVDEPFIAWSQLCLNGDLEVMFAASVKPVMTLRRWKGTRPGISSVTPDASLTTSVEQPCLGL